MMRTASSIKGTAESGSLFRSKVLKDTGQPVFGMPHLEGRIKGEELRKPAGPTPAEHIAAIEKEGYRKGYAAGERAGLEVGQQKAAALLQRLQHTLNELIDRKNNLSREIEPGLLKLSVAIARKVIATELKQSPESIAELVKAALRKVEKTGPVTIKLNPAVAELIQKIKPELMAIHPDIVFDVDPSASATGPVVIGPADEVVTEIDGQIREIERELEAMHAAVRP